MATATKSKTATKSTATRERRIDPTKDDYSIVTEAPVFATSGGREKTPLRRMVEDLNEGEWLNTERDSDRDLINLRSMVQNVRKANPGSKFAVRRAADKVIWIGRTQ